MRIRFSNIKGQTDVWHDVGIVPTVDIGSERRSESAIKAEKGLLLNRFKHLAFRDIMRVSHVCYFVSGSLIYPRLGVKVYDQPQERAELGLKDHGSFRDCSLCLMPTKMRNAGPPGGADVRNSKRQRAISGMESGGEAGNEGARVCAEVEVEEASASDMIREIQLGPEVYERRSVCATVSRQILIAGRKYIGHPRYDEAPFLMKEAKGYLEDTSAQELPPAMAGFAGLGSRPHRLYSSIGFDKLHVVEHGILRMIPDDTYKVFDTAVQYHGWSRAEIAKIANQRMLDVPRSAQRPLFQPFRKSGTEKGAGITGKMRRDSAPFLWYALMGIPRKTAPDDDPLVQLLLMVDWMQQELLGINRNSDFSLRTSDELDEPQNLCFDVGKLTAETFGIFVTTKLHRIMRHTKDHFTDHGCIRRGATDENETLHKHTKKAYSSTNKHLLNIAAQLLKARVRLESEQSENVRNLASTQFQLLLTRNPAVSQDERPNADQSTPNVESVRDEDSKYVALMRQVVKSMKCPEEAERAVSKFLHPTTNRKVWVQMKSARFRAVFPWMPDRQVWQVVYAGKMVFGIENRRDAVAYKVGRESFFGIVQAIFCQSNDRNNRITLVRRLKEVPGEDGNRLVVDKFGNRRFAYAVVDGGIEVDCVPRASFLRAVMIVPDPWMVSRLYGARQRLNSLEDTPTSRRKMRFFEVAGFKYTSLAEQSPLV